MIEYEVMKNQLTYAEVQVQSALNFAASKHAYQWRKDSGSPYILHPLQVSHRLALWGILKEDWTATHVAAILHDTIEDTDATYEEIDFLYGNRVASIVRELTFRGTEPGENSSSYAAAKETYLMSFATSSVDSLVIKIADRMHNVEDYLSKEKQQRYAVKYFDKASSLISAFRDRFSEISQRFGVLVSNEMAVDIASLIEKIEIQRAA